MNKDIKIVVMSRGNAEQFAGLLTGTDGKRRYVKYAVISVGADENDPAKLPTPYELQGVLRLYFWDIDKPVDDGKEEPRLITVQDACAIWDFLESLADDVELLVVHCAMGFSRSPGIAAAIEKAIGRDDAYWFRAKNPNRLVYRTVLNEYYTRNHDTEPDGEDSGSKDLHTS